MDTWTLPSAWMTHSLTVHVAILYNIFSIYRGDTSGTIHVHIERDISGAMYIHTRRDTGGPMHQVTYTLHVKQSKENYVLVHLQFTLELYMYTQNLLS